jgi:hypothetical protein
MSLIATALLCALTIAPADCSRDNATDVLTFGTTDNELSCMRDAMTALAGLAIEAGEDAYWKIECRRT